MKHYDALAALFSDSDGLGRTRSSPKGAEGARRWSFSVSSVERDLVEDTDELIEHIREKTGLEAQVLLFRVEEGGGDDMADTHTIVVGEQSSDPSRSWALQITAVLPHVEDFDTSADMVVIEHADEIARLMNAELHQSFVDAAEEIGAIMTRAVGSDSKLVEQVFALIRAQPDQGAWLRQWEAGQQTQRLEQQTAPAKSKTRRRRI